MKTWKQMAILALVIFLSGVLICGCTGGEESSDGGGVSPEPTASPTVTPTGTNTPTFPTSDKLTTFVSGGSNIFNLQLWGDTNIYPFTDQTNSIYTGEDVYWVESVANPNGRIAMQTNTRATGIDVVLGLNLPGSFLLHRHNGSDYLFVADSGGGSGGGLYRYNISKPSEDPVTLVAGLQGDVRYIAFDDPSSNNPYLYYAVNAGGSTSVLARVDAYAIKPEADILDNSLSNVHHVYVYRHNIPIGAIDPTSGDPILPYPDANTFVFVTENSANPDGRVLMYNVSGWDGAKPLTPVVINVAGGKNFPSKITFLPDIEKYDVVGGFTYGHSLSIRGNLFWTNYSANQGELWGATLVLNSGKDNLQVDGSAKKIVQSLRFSYDLIGPDDFRYVFLQASGNKFVQTIGAKYDVWNSYDEAGLNTFYKLYVSRNEPRGNGGNWYEIDLTGYNNAPLSPATQYVKSYCSENAQYPLNGIMQILLYEKGDGSVPQAFEKQLYFTGSSYDSGTDNAYVYIQTNKFPPPGE